MSSLKTSLSPASFAAHNSVTHWKGMLHINNFSHKIFIGSEVLYTSISGNVRGKYIAALKQTVYVSLSLSL